jgi:hypothetical protein
MRVGSDLVVEEEEEEGEEEEEAVVVVVVVWMCMLQAVYMLRPTQVQGGMDRRVQEEDQGRSRRGRYKHRFIFMDWMGRFG